MAVLTKHCKMKYLECNLGGGGEPHTVTVTTKGTSA